MSLQVAVAHTGQRLDADPVSFNSIDALKVWIEKATQIPPQDQILLTLRGKHATLQALLTEKEVFVYDRELFNLSASQSTVSPTTLPDPYTADDPPDTLTSHTDLSAWQRLFKARRDWAFEVLRKSESMSQVASRYFSEQATVEKATQIAVGNHDAHIRSLQQKHQHASAWFDDVSKETGDNMRNLDRDLSQLVSIPARWEFIQFIRTGVRTPQKPPKAAVNRITLQDYLDVEAIKKATTVGKRVRETFGKGIVEMKSQIEKIASDYNELRGAVDQSQSRSLVEDAEEPVRLYNEILAVTKKVDSDYVHVMGLPGNPKSVAQVSKMALLHTRNFLPAIKEYSAEMSDLVRRSVEQKNSTVQNALESMRSISTIESLISSLTAELDNLDIPQDGLDAFEQISLVSRLPFIYGTLMVEAVRRREWVEKRKLDTSAFAEEMAGFQEEEERRRKKWVKPIADVVNPEMVQCNILGFEMNVQSERDPWPAITRDDLDDYLRAIRGLEGLQTSSESLNQAIKELDRPTKQQIKRAKNFKMGSVHEPAFGKASFLLRGDDGVRALKEANIKLEDELKGSKSRIRRLEDLLHRQSHVRRLSIGSGFPSMGGQSPADPSTPVGETASPRPQEELSRQSSVSSRRFSSNQGPEQQALARRLLKLEAELAAEKEARATLEKESQSRRDEDEQLRRELDEANSNKKDIMENMEAQQKEFAQMRRTLEQEVANYKSRIEEVEDEMDRVLGSRDNERSGTDARVSELEKAQKDASEELEVACKQIKGLQSDLARYRETEYLQHETLSAAYACLSGDEAPEDHATLVSQLEELVLRSRKQLEALEQALALAHSENESMRAEAEKKQTELDSRLRDQEAEAQSLREQLDSEKAKAGSVEAELKEEREHLHDLRTKFAEGETGSEVLRQRVEEEEAKVGVLRMQLAEAQSHANSLDVELMHLQKKMSRYEEVDASRAHRRSIRTKELSQRLYAQHERLLRLLQTLGFIVTYEDGAMVLQRAPRVSSASTILNDNNLARSTTTSPAPMKEQLEENVDLSFLQWSEANDPEEEDQRYSEFLNTLQRFNLETFAESVTKRMRDTEHTARKMQREARAYRDKAHRFHSEAHEKIAFKSFKEGDLALFLPTRNQATRPWAAFNVGAPHYFLREQDAHKLHGREWLVARISKVEERVVDLSKAMNGASRQSMDGRSVASEAAVSFEDDNPFELSDGLRWYLLDAAEEKPGAPSTPGLGKTTVASANVDAKGSIRMTKKSSSTDPAKTLGKSLDSRRSSGTSKRSVPLALTNRTSTEAMNVSGENDNNTDPEPKINAATRGVSPSDGPGPSNLRNESSEVERLLDGTDEGGVRLSSDFARKSSNAGASMTANGVLRNSTPIGPRTTSPNKSRMGLGVEGAAAVRSGSPNVSPSKQPPKERSKPGIWDSLFQYDISYQSSKGKK